MHPTNRQGDPIAPATFNWRKDLPVHPACAAFPELSRDELTALGNDIKTNGLRLPVVVHAEGDPSNPEFKLIDGRSRLDAMVAVGIEFKIERVHCEEHDRTSLRLNISSIPIGASGRNVQMAIGHSEAEIKDLVVSLNAHRRHLTAEKKRGLIAKLLKAKPESSNAQIAKQSMADDKTVAKVRAGLESTSEIPRLKKTVGADGKTRPVKAKKKLIVATVPPAPKEATIDGAPEAKPALATKLPNEAGDENECAALGGKPEDIGAFLEGLGTDRFFAALQHAPTIKASIERRHERRHKDHGASDKIITLVGECRAHLQNPKPANIETVFKKLARIANMCANGTKAVATGKKPALDMGALGRGLCLDEPAVTQPAPNNGSNLPIPDDLTVPDFLRRGGAAS
jgi:hypothetical protein